MNIETYDIVKYLINNKYVVIQNSNNVIVRLINPIIDFKQVVCNNRVKVKITNNSGTCISNLIYINCNERIILGNLRNYESICFEYENKNKCREALIKYSIRIGNKKNTMYIINKKFKNFIH